MKKELKFEVDLAKVRSVYVGKHGCMCGCRGTHFYASGFQEEQGKARGYQVKDDEVDDAKVKRVVSKFNRADFFYTDINPTSKGPEDNRDHYIFMESTASVWVIYFK